MNLDLAVLLMAAVTAVLCAITGSLLIVRRDSMISEGLSHAVLPGIVIGFLLIGQRHSPWLVCGAAAGGLAMVWSVAMLRRTGLVASDAALGIVFSAMFSFGVLLISRYLRGTMFSPEVIIDGNLALAALDQWQWRGHDLGPRSLTWLILTLAIMLVFVNVSYKELKLMMFDRMTAHRFGYRPNYIDTVWVSLVSLVTVVAFEVAGSILIVALMIAPPACAYLLVKRLSQMLIVSSCFGVFSAWLGFVISGWLDVAPTAPMAATAGLLFLIIAVLGPQQGILASWLGRRRGHQHWNEKILQTAVEKLGRFDAEQLAEKLDWPVAKVQAVKQSMSSTTIATNQ